MWTGILLCAIGRAKKVAFSESCDVARVAYFGQITNIGCGRGGKLVKELSREGRGISVHDCAREKGCRLKIARNRTRSIFRPNNDDWEQSREKVLKGALPGEL